MTSNSEAREFSIDCENQCTGNRFIVLAMLIVIGVAYYPRLAVADESARPFQAKFTALPEGDIVVAGGGVATHLGNYHLQMFRQVASAPTPSDPCVGFLFMFAVLTSADGDELWMDYTDGELCFDLTNYPVSVTFTGEVNLVGVGGTGRFTESTGNYQMNWSGEISATGVVNGGEIEGVIGY
jgi:hypothetical protein